MLHRWTLLVSTRNIKLCYHALGVDKVCQAHDSPGSTTPIFKVALNPFKSRLGVPISICVRLYCATGTYITFITVLDLRGWARVW